MAASTLWVFAHRALAALFHENPVRFVAALDGGAAGAFLEQRWRWALQASGKTSPAQPPMKYSIDRPRPGLAIIAMQFTSVTVTGEPWHVRFIVREPDAGQTNGYMRMFLLEHSEYATELSGGTPQAIVCESLLDGRHRNWGVTMAPDDEAGFDRFVIETIRTNPQPTAEFTPPKQS